MANFIDLSKFVKQYAKKAATKEIEDSGKTYFLSIFDFITDLANDFGLKNITQKKGGGLALGTRRGRQIKAYIWYKIAFEKFSDLPISIGIFIFADSFDVSLQIDMKKIKKKEINCQLKNYARFYNEKINKALCYYANDDQNREIDIRKYSILTDYIKTNPRIQKIVPHYQIMVSTNEKIETEIRKGVEHIFPLYEKIISGEKLKSNDPFEIFDFEATNGFSKSHAVGIKRHLAKVTNDVHYQMQKKLIKELENKYSKSGKIKHEVKINKYRADIMVRLSDTEYEIYEVKPYILPKDCIREASGQLLEYKYRLENMKTSTGKKIVVKKLIIVGRSMKDDDSIKYINFLNNLLNEEIFKYYPVQLNKRR